MKKEQYGGDAYGNNKDGYGKGNEVGFFIARKNLGAIEIVLSGQGLWL